ncbi:unnamed protein product [Brassicogethes aeneus]|uniref:NOL1/NOP2/Sun domain family member 4 n=1 Tax=Brassicogethes aeneus TaxID=1431903 RepID=A0A9P0BLZ8_BRAAE|nr:unnamed protein product [Brassicogethes aeneus]
MLSYSIFKHFSKQSKQIIRCKHAPDHWSVVRKKIHPVDKAMEHFDDFYRQVFGKKKWSDIREGLLGKQKYVAVVNNLSDSDETMKKFELEGAINVRKVFQIEKERLQEELAVSKRNSVLNKIFRLDKEMDKQLETKEEIKNVELFSAKNFSLKTSLETADYDKRRLVDSKNALSAEILHEYVPTSKIKGKDDFIPESAHYKLYDTSSEFSVTVEKEFDIHFPENLNVYCYMTEDTNFAPALNGETGVLNYYLMDGGSILPVLALDIKPGNRVLDMCASPGGKSLLALQTLYTDLVVSNDVSMSRVNRIQGVYKQFLYDFKEKWNNTRVKLTNMDGRYITDDTFDRILVDVPCTTDRHSLRENENNIFKPQRIKERLKLPELQCELLVNALKLIKKGGVVVYSTCSLSPIQNDGVVHMALKQIWEETKIKIVIKDLSPALMQGRHIYKFADKQLLKYGSLVLPNLANNFGPTYFCKFKRIK